MKIRLRSAGIIGTMLAVVLPQLAITTAAVVLTPTVAEAQAGRMHRATRRRTAVVVHTHDQQQAAAQQQQQQQQQQAEPQQQSMASPEAEAQHTMTVDAQADKGHEASPVVDGGASAAVVAREPPDAVQRAVRDGQRLRA